MTENELPVNPGGNDPSGDNQKELSPTLFNRQRYQEILGLTEFPASPDSMPDSFILPPEIGTAFADVMKQTLEDEREHGGSSITQNGHVNFDSRFISRKHSVSENPFIPTKVRNKDEQLVRYHTHPGKEFMDTFQKPKGFVLTDTGIFVPDLKEGSYSDFKHSNADIGNIIAEPNRALLDAVVHPGGISLIAKTDATTKSRFPDVTRILTRKRLATMEHDHPKENPFVRDAKIWIDMIKYLEAHGFAYYYGRPDAPGLESRIPERSMDDGVKNYYLFQQKYDTVINPNTKTFDMQFREVTPDFLQNGIRMQRLRITPAVEEKFGKK